MARLDQQKRKEWKAALSLPGAPWVVCGINLSEERASAMLEGMPGLIDWKVHGQVSNLILRKKIQIGEACLIPGDPQLQRPSYLFFSLRSPSSAQALLEKMRKLKINELVIAESTFPEDFLAKLKQTLKKEGTRVTKLEPEIT